MLNFSIYYSQLSANRLYIYRNTFDIIEKNIFVIFDCYAHIVNSAYNIERGDSTLEVKLSKQVLKYINIQDKPTKERIKQALIGLSSEPPIGDIVPLINNPPFLRLRIGSLRAIFYEDNGKIRVVKISPRGQSYK